MTFSVIFVKCVTMVVHQTVSREVFAPLFHMMHHWLNFYPKTSQKAKFEM